MEKSPGGSGLNLPMRGGQGRSGETSDGGGSDGGDDVEESGRASTTTYEANSDQFTSVGEQPAATHGSLEATDILSRLPRCTCSRAAPVLHPTYSRAPPVFYAISSTGPTVGQGCCLEYRVG
jgi:hypothetical protein